MLPIVDYIVKKPVDWDRLRVFSFYGFVVYGPLLMVSYDKILPRIAPGPQTLANLALKIFYT